MAGKPAFGGKKAAPFVKGGSVQLNTRILPRERCVRNQPKVNNG